MARFTVTIKPGKYKGQYEVKPFEKPPLVKGVTGEKTLNLEPGLYLLDTGAAVGKSEIRFEVKADGKIVIRAPLIAATARGSVVSFNSARIRIDPGDMHGTWEPSWVKGHKPISGAAGTVHVHLVRGLRYYIGTGARQGLGNSGTASVFYFDVTPAGFPRSRNSKAASGGRKLRFKTRQLYVDGSTLSKGPVKVSGYGTIKKTGQTIELIRSLKYAMRTAAEDRDIYINVY